MSMNPPRAPVPPRFTRDSRGVLTVSLSAAPTTEDIDAIMVEVDKDLATLRPLSWWQRLLCISDDRETNRQGQPLPLSWWSRLVEWLR